MRNEINNELCKGLEITSSYNRDWFSFGVALEWEQMNTEKVGFHPFFLIGYKGP